MKITIFGGTGEAGLILVKKALKKGHNVTVFARTPSKISFQNIHLRIIKGELTDIASLEEAIRGADAVISVLGPVAKTKGLTLANGVKSIISVMKKNNVKRLIATATPSFKDEKDKFQFGYAVTIFMIKNMLKNSYLNIVEIGKHITTSELDWTLVRIPMLSKGSAKGHLKIGYPGEGKVNLFSLNREDLADFLLQQLDNKEWLRKSPVISN